MEFKSRCTRCCSEWLAMKLARKPAFEWHQYVLDNTKMGVAAVCFHVALKAWNSNKSNVGHTVCRRWNEKLSTWATIHSHQLSVVVHVTNHEKREEARVGQRVGERNAFQSSAFLHSTMANHTCDANVTFDHMKPYFT